MLLQLISPSCAFWRAALPRSSMFKTCRPLGLVVCGMDATASSNSVSHVPAPNKSNRIFLGHPGLVLRPVPHKKGSKQNNFHDRSSISTFSELAASRLASNCLAACQSEPSTDVLWATLQRLEPFLEQSS